MASPVVDRRVDSRATLVMWCQLPTPNKLPVISVRSRRAPPNPGEAASETPYSTFTYTNPHVSFGSTGWLL